MKFGIHSSKLNPEDESIKEKANMKITKKCQDITNYANLTKILKID